MVGVGVTPARRTARLHRGELPAEALCWPRRHAQGRVEFRPDRPVIAHGLTPLRESLPPLPAPPRAVQRSGQRGPTVRPTHRAGVRYRARVSHRQAPLHRRVLQRLQTAHVPAASHCAGGRAGPLLELNAGRRVGGLCHRRTQLPARRRPRSAATTHLRRACGRVRAAASRRPIVRRARGGSSATARRLRTRPRGRFYSTRRAYLGSAAAGLG